jgi:hypothetical protein
MYSLCLVGGCGIYRSGSGKLTSYNLYRLSCAIYKWDRVELAAYSLYMSWLAIYSMGGVEDMRHIRWGWGQHRSGIGMWVR